MQLPMMNASEVATWIAEDSGISKTDVKHVLASLEELVCAALLECQRVKIANVVQLEPKEKKATKKRMGRNPRTGEEVEVSAKPASVRVAARVLKPAKESAPSLPRLRKALS